MNVCKHIVKLYRDPSMNCVIIGGGVAGLSAAIRLTELGASPILIESGQYPAHKVCGEFFGPASLNQLRTWNLKPTEIGKMCLHLPSNSIEMQFPTPAASLSHFQCDALLAQRARQGGATIMTNTTVQKLMPGKKHQVHLSTGEILQADQLIIATGRLPHIQKPSKFPYMGLKAHFAELDLSNQLEMFAFPGAYVGISPIEEGKFNVACLVKQEVYALWKNHTAFLNHLMQQNSHFKAILSKGKPLFNEWMQVSIPEFGIKNNPDWPETYYIGDAAGTIPPITGNGLSMAMQGGIMAAEHTQRSDFVGFKKAWRNRYVLPIYSGKLLHQIALSKALSKSFIKLAKFSPNMLTKVYQWTR